MRCNTKNESVTEKNKTVMILLLVIFIATCHNDFLFDKTKSDSFERVFLTVITRTSWKDKRPKTNCKSTANKQAGRIITEWQAHIQNTAYSLETNSEVGIHKKIMNVLLEISTGIRCQSTLQRLTDDCLRICILIPECAYRTCTYPVKTRV